MEDLEYWKSRCLRAEKELSTQLLQTKMVSYGVELFDTLRKENLVVPRLIFEAVRCLVGVLHVPDFFLPIVDNSVVATKEAELNKGILSFHDCEPTVISTIFKKYLMLLPTPLLSLRIFEPYLVVTHTEQSGAAALCNIIGALPSPVGTLLEFVSAFTNQVASKASKNNMPLNTLAKILAPYLFGLSMFNLQGDFGPEKTGELTQSVSSLSLSEYSPLGEEFSDLITRCTTITSAIFKQHKLVFEDVKVKQELPKIPTLRVQLILFPFLSSIHLTFLAQAFFSSTFQRFRRS